MKSGKIRLKNLFPKVLVVLSAALLTTLLTQDYVFTFAPLKELELKLIDVRFLHRGKIDLADSSKVIIVEISQESYDQIPPPYNKWPWPRFIFAKVIENLTKAGVKAIGIDIDMAGPDQFSPRNDSLMMRAIRKSGKVVVAGKIDDVKERMVEENVTWVKKINENFDNIFYAADSSIGIVRVSPDYDGVYRRYFPYVKSNVTNSRVPSFAYALLNKYYGLKSSYTALRSGNFINYNGKLIPRYDSYSSLVNFYGPSGTFPRIKLIDVLDNKDFKTIDELNSGESINTWDDPDYGLLRSGIFKDKIAIIGSTMPEDRDLLPVSFAMGQQKGDNQIYGVEFHANMLQNILSGNYLSVQSKEAEVLIILLLTAVSFFISSVIRKIKLRYGWLVEVINVAFVVLSVFLIFEASIFLFIHSKLVIMLVSYSLSVVLGYFSSTAYHFIRERQQNVLIKGMFSQYVSKDVVNELLLNPEKVRLGGEKKNVTILFSDIAGFTTFSEKKQPEELVSFINEYLNEMTEIILANEGTLDKYLGDSIMAFWGAPIEVKDHAFKACQAAIQMQDKLLQLSEKWMKSGESVISVRVGINSGDVIVGNIGGKKRFDYTVMGDNVNLASRLEGANKEYGTRTMISDYTYDLVKDKILARELDLIKVKGKTKPTKAFELIGLSTDEKAKNEEYKLADYLNAIILYHNREFDKALPLFERSFEQTGDNPSKVYIERCRLYLKNPPDKSRDGVFEMKTK
jgi:adenylate cyclase